MSEMMVTIQTTVGEVDVEAEIAGVWALHRGYSSAHVLDDRWTVTWITSGHAVASGLPGGVAGRVFRMLAEKWPAWPRRKEGGPLSVAIKRRTRNQMLADVAAIVEGT